MNLILKCCALALTCVLFGLLLKERASPLALPMELAAAACLLLLAFSAARGRFSSFFSVLQSMKLPTELFGVLLKGAGVTLLSELCAAVCKETGHAAVADVIALIGRLLVLLLCLPLIESVLQTVAGML